MFWKNANLRSLSLVTKLMILYTLSTIGILLAITIFLYPTFIHVAQYINGNLGNYLINICYKKIVIALLLSSLGAILIGYFIAKKSLSKVHEFSDKMEIISASSLHERMNLNDWPKELKSLGIKFNHMLDRLELSFTKLSQFSSNIAHELRTPIHNLRNITELALSKQRTQDEYIRLLESSTEEYEQLTKLIENLFFLAHADHGQIQLKKSSFNVRYEIEKLCDYFSALANEKNIQISYDGEDIITVDPTLFRRVLSNILSNALKYTPGFGKINIEIKPNQISIHDSGIGISEEHLPHIFDRFYRADPSRTSPGLGLGLAIVKSIMDLHQGTIQIKSQENIGTSVFLFLV